MIPYILYAAIVITASLIFYKLLLQRETFFRLNRFVLLGCTVLAFLLPLIHVPQQLSFRKATPAINLTLPETTVLQTGTVQPTPDNTVAKNTEPTQQKQGIDTEQVMLWFVYLYWFGVAIFALNFIFQASLLLHTAYSRPVIIDGRFRIVEMSGDKAPCSFLNNIFINPEKYDWETYNQVLLHEKIHIEQQHTLDLLLAEIALIFQWFNPFAWQWRKELESNLEFFTDNQLIQQQTVVKESYQLSLLKVAAPHFPLSLTTNYNQSLLKKRLLMMNAKKSNVHTIWKYFFLLPLMVIFVCLLNEPVVISQTTAIKSTTKPAPHAQTNNDIRTKGNWFATIKDDKINMQFKSDDEENSSNGNSFQLSEFTDLPREKQGIFSLTRDAGTIEFKGKFEGDKGMGEYKFTPNKEYGTEIKNEGINVTGDGDLMVFFLVNIKRSYVPMLKKNGYTDLDKDKLIPLAALDVNEGYIKSIKEAGFTEIDLDNLVPFKALGIDKAYIDEIRKSGYKSVTPDNIITLKAQGIDGKYITDFRSSTKADLNDDDDRAPAGNGNKNTHSDKTEKNINKDKRKGDDEDDIIAFKAMNIDNAFVNSLKEVGYDHLSNSDLISMKALGVTPEYIRSFQDAGYKDIKPDQLISLKAQNVTPAIIQEYKALGFENVNLDDVVGAKATGTSPSFIKSMRDKGHNMKSLDKYIALRAVLGN